MLHAKFQDHRNFDSKEEDCSMIFYIYGYGSHLRLCDLDHLYKFLFPSKRMLHIKFGFDRPSGFGEETV